MLFFFFFLFISLLVFESLVYDNPPVMFLKSKKKKM